MKNTKQQNKFAQLVSDLNELSEKEFKALIRCAKQQRRASRALEHELIRQKRETLPTKSKSTKSTIEGMSYEPAY